MGGKLGKVLLGVVGVVVVLTVLASLSTPQQSGPASPTAVGGGQPGAATPNQPTAPAVAATPTQPTRPAATATPATAGAPTALPTAPIAPIGPRGAPTRPASAAPAPPTPAPAGRASGSDPCTVTAAKMISEGGDQDWSHASDSIVFDRIDKDGVYQLHTARPDGSDERCLSCTQRPGAPPVERHKFNPTWHASGKYVVLQGEIDNHPLAFTHKNRMVAELLLNGLWNNLYATDSTGERWYKLTTSASPQTDGVLGPHFSPDGTKLLWSRLVSPASGENPWGLWRLMIGDFIVRGDVPSLQNVTDITPTGGKFYEAHGFSADGGTVVFTSDMETTSRWEMNIWVMSLSDKKLTKLTKGGSWNEHAQYSPSGNKIVYMSSEPYPGTALKTDLMIMNSDGSGKAQLTHFNMPGYPESQPDQNVPGRSSWSADGARLSVTAGPAKDFPTRRLWILTFAGPCGA